MGIAQGALNDIVAVASGGKHPALSLRRLADSPVFQDQLGEASTTLRAARALLFEEAESVCEREGAEAATSLRRAALRATAARVISMSTGVVDVAFAQGGASAVYDASPLQRRLRDAHTAAQHFVAGRDFYGIVGALLAGAEAGTNAF